MAQPPLPPAEMRRRLKAWRQAGGNTTAAAVALGVSRSTIQSTINVAVRQGLVKRREIVAGGATVKTKGVDFNLDRKAFEKQIAELTAEVDRLRAVKRVRYPKAPKISRGPDDFIRVIKPDTHGMYANAAAFSAFVADMKMLSPHEVIDGGDFSDCGGFLSQHHALGYVAMGSYTYEQDMEAVNAQYDAMQAAAPRARFETLEGNHEQRIERWCIDQTLGNGRDAEGLRQRNAPEYLCRFKERGVRYYRMADFHDGLPVRGTIRRGKCFFVHQPPRGCGSPGAIARRFGGCVVYFHTHQSREELVRTVVADTIGAFNPGCLAELQPLYCHTEPTNWSHGYGVQLVARSGAFLHINVPIINGVSHLRPLLERG